MTLSQLVESFRQLTTELFTRSYDVGFAGINKTCLLIAWTMDMFNNTAILFSHHYYNVYFRALNCKIVNSINSLLKNIAVFVDKTEILISVSIMPNCLYLNLDMINLSF